MKKFLSLILVVLMVLSMAACGEDETTSSGGSYKSDVQNYIKENIDSTAKITVFEKKSSDVDGNKLTVNCVALYEGEDGEQKDEFVLTYYKDGKAWEFINCVVVDKQSGGQNVEPETEPSEEVEVTTPVATKPTATETKPSASAPSAVSDDWKEFTFEFDGQIYQLPTSYETFVNNGWTIKNSSYAADADYVLAGKSHVDAYLSNGSVEIYADFVNMSGNARKITDCDVGGITVKGNKNLSLTVAGGLSLSSTKDEIEAAYGAPSNSYISDDSSSLTYEVDTYNKMKFYIYNEDTKYNEITITNFVASDRDATTPKDERPAYLDDYKAPEELSSDVKSTQFILDGVVYQLPCPLNAFTDNGWTIKSDSLGTLSALNKNYGVTITKDGYNVSLYMINYAEYETYTKNCAVCQVSFDPYYFKNAPKDIVQLPGGITMWSTLEEAAALYQGFEFYEGTYSTSYTYQNKDYTEEVKYSYSHDDKDADLTVENQIWNY